MYDTLATEIGVGFHVISRAKYQFIFQRPSQYSLIEALESHLHKLLVQLWWLDPSAPHLVVGTQPMDDSGGDGNKAEDA